ncbi:hypothetical protein XA68_10497 [Ophiocordyceps unilateralis]|uniref:Hydrophobin 3 n=1 Tax=Ophiocordyceps unilateralis TaxID=268505 RepID=A0A2A9NZ17_OPHUN|nr:hypothetical protein XA68_10497 [Ophiocordyceps unilateralis]
MKCSAALSFVALAAAAIAAPSEATGGTCNGNQKQVCCSGNLLACLVQVLGTACNGQRYCCSTSAGTGALVNVQALNCVQL